jgi:DNA-binding transcriptional MerR regulator
MHPPRATASTTKVRYLVGEVAEMTGLSTHVLRVWELRYGWPKPEHGPNRFRYYSASLANTLQWVSAQIRRGRAIGEVLRDPLFSQIESATVSSPRSKRGTADFGHIPDPITDDGLRLRRAMEQAIATNDQGTMARIQAESFRLKPEERERACGALMREQR